MLVLSGSGYDSLPRRSALHRQTSAGSTAGSCSAAGSGCVSNSCVQVVAECEKKVKLLEEILRLQDEALQAGKQQKALAASRTAASSALPSPSAAVKEVYSCQPLATTTTAATTTSAATPLCTAGVSVT